jgi:hypothetical protein
MIIADRQTRSHNNRPVGTTAYFNSAKKSQSNNLQMHVAYYASEPLQ